MRACVTILLAALFLAPAASVTFAIPSQKRVAALNALVVAYSKYRTGHEKEGREGIEKALAIDRDLAYANVVRGEVAMKEADWQTAQKFLERGLVLLRQTDQPLSPDKNTRVRVSDVEGDTRCFMGYVYVKLAQRANRAGNDSMEQKYLELANRSLRAGLALTPGKEARELAEGLLRMFR